MSFQETWQQAAEHADEGFQPSQPPDPGMYDIEIRDAKAFTSNAGNDTVVIELRLASGPHQGHEWAIILGFGSEGAAKVAAAQCSRLGVHVKDVASLDELDRALKQHVGEYHTVEVKQNGQYRNTWLQGQITTAPPASDVPVDTTDFQPAAAPAGNVPPDDIPF